MQQPFSEQLKKKNKASPSCFWHRRNLWKDIFIRSCTCAYSIQLERSCVRDLLLQPPLRDIMHCLTTTFYLSQKFQSSPKWVEALLYWTCSCQTFYGLKNQHFKLPTLNTTAVALKQFPFFPSMLFSFFPFSPGSVRSVAFSSILSFGVLLQAVRSEITA